MQLPGLARLSGLSVIVLFMRYIVGKRFFSINFDFKICQSYNRESCSRKCKFQVREKYYYLGSVHYLYPGLVPKRNGLGKPFFWSVKGWVISFLKKV